MARLNIESTIFQDMRFLNLVTKIGNPYEALGRLVMFWSKAQQSWANGSKLDQNEFLPEWRVLIEVGFAEEHEDGIYAKGAETHFGWLRKRHEAAKRGGSRGGKAKASKPKQTKAKLSKADPLTLTLSLTPSPALAEVTGGVPPEPKTPGSRVWQAYAVAYQQAYQQAPTSNARNYALASQLVKRLGEEDATRVVQFFLSHRKRWYVDKVHDLACCVSDAEGLLTQARANHRVSSSDARAQDQSQANEQVFAAVAARMEARRAGKEAPDAGE